MQMAQFECPWYQIPCLIQYLSWVNYLFPLLALWGNKNWTPSMKVKKLENFQNKSSLKGWKWSRLSVHGTEKPLTSPLLLFVA